MFLPKQLLAFIPDGKIIAPGKDMPVHSLACDSRQAGQGGLFVCIKGGKADGHLHAADAVRRGAVAVVVEDVDRLASLPTHVTLISTRDSRSALARLACEFYGQPSTRLKLVGVTGTNGKTTTTHLIASIFRAGGERAAIIGTLGAITEDGIVPLANTTPDALQLQQLLARFAREGYGAAAMEVSSHALAMSRVEGCVFDAAVFTNLSQDHLDFHRDLESYFQTKARLFTSHAEAAAFGAVINTDDSYGQRLVKLCSCPVLTFGIRKSADIMAEELNLSAAGATFYVRTPRWRERVTLKLTGRFNVENALAAAAVAELKGISPGAILTGLEKLTSVPGRMEMVNEGQNFGVAVDYAHTPDGLEKALRAAREMTKGRLIVVFGCGGDRDRGKRPQMGALADELADVCVLTSDNPRSERPEAILDEICQGIGGLAQCHVEQDRRSAIELALNLATEGDVVLLAGKGHETGQIFADRTIPFDDREVARESLRRRLGAAPTR